KKQSVGHVDGSRRLSAFNFPHRSLLLFARSTVRAIQRKQKDVAAGRRPVRGEQEFRLGAENKYTRVSRSGTFNSTRELWHLSEEIAWVNLSHGFCGRVGKEEWPKRYNRQPNQQQNDRRTPSPQRKKLPQP